MPRIDLDGLTADDAAMLSAYFGAIFHEICAKERDDDKTSRMMAFAADILSRFIVE